MTTKEEIEKARQEVRDAVEKFRRLCETSRDIDYGDQLDWYSVSIGFFLSCGLTADEAQLAALYVRYELQYWNDDQKSQAQGPVKKGQESVEDAKS
jgi:hypothetical protein